MPIRRPRGPKPALRYLAFLEMMAAARSRNELRGALSTFATLRLFDHWVALGAEMVEEDGRAHTITLRTVRSLRHDPRLRAALRSILDALVLLQEPDAHALAARLFALAELYEERAQFTPAAEVYASVIRCVDTSIRDDLAFRARVRRAYCLLVIGEFEWAEMEYTLAAALAARQPDRSRVLVARIGLAKVDLARGNVKSADKTMRAVAREFERRLATAPRRAPSPTPRGRAR